MTVVIECMGIGEGVQGRGPDIVGCYLLSWDVDAYEGLGYAEWTEHLEHAWVFASNAEAYATWRARSKVRPVREDGKANRPLTAFSISLVTVEIKEGFP